jgi:DNA-binding response OmpR family regulator
MTRVLVVEDDPDIATLVRLALERAGHAVDVCGTGPEALRLARTQPPDLVVLDWMLPGMDGLLVCQALRQDAVTSRLPIIMLTARGEEVDRVRGLELGADDYIVKPFSPRELAARVSAVLRRVESPTVATALLRHGPLTIDVDRHLVRVEDREVRLTAKEFLLLRYLLEHRGRVLSRDRLLTDVWGYQYTGGTRTVDVHVRRLREKIPLLATTITTVKQFGYKLDDPTPDAGLRRSGP